MKTFEIHTFRDAQWKVDSVFDDRELAVHEARKVDENGRYAGVRVIEENYDESSDHTTIRTIFLGKKERAKSKARIPIAKKSGRAANRNKASGSIAENLARGRGKRSQVASSFPCLFFFCLSLPVSPCCWVSIMWIALNSNVVLGIGCALQDRDERTESHCRAAAQEYGTIALGHGE